MILDTFLGQPVTIYCVNYIYHGTLVELDEHEAVLDPAWIVYNTGDHSQKTFASAKKLPNVWYIPLQAIEGYGVFKEITT